MINKQTLRRFLFVVPIIAVFSCGSDKDSDNDKTIKPDYFAIEEKIIDSTISSDQNIQHYAAVKATLRALGAVEELRPEFLRSENYEVARKYVFKLMAGDAPDMTEALTDIPSVLKLYDILINTPEEFYEIDENNYPTILESICNISQNKMPISEWNAAYESLILAATVKYSDLSPAIALYELRNTKFNLITDNEIKALAQLYYAVEYLRYQMPYHAADAASKSLKTIQDSEKLSGTFSRSLLMSSEKDPENTRQNFEAICYLIMGLAYDQMEDADDKSNAIGPLQKFVEISSVQPVGSEWQILSEAVTLVIDNKNKASVEELQLLMQTKSLTGQEKFEIGKLLGQTRGKDISADLRNIVIAGVIAEKLYSFLQRTNFYDSLTDSDAGEAFALIMPNLDEYLLAIKALESISGLF